MAWYRRAFAILTLAFAFMALILTFWPALLRLIPVPGAFTVQKNFKQELLRQSGDIAARMTRNPF